MAHNHRFPSRSTQIIKVLLFFWVWINSTKMPFCVWDSHNSYKKNIMDGPTTRMKNILSALASTRKICQGKHCLDILCRRLAGYTPKGCSRGRYDELRWSANRNPTAYQCQQDPKLGNLYKMTLPPAYSMRIGHTPTESEDHSGLPSTKDTY